MSKADSVTITVLVENSIDILLAGEREGSVHRCDLVHHFDLKKTPVQAEFGVSFLVEIVSGRHPSTILFDAGLTGSVLAHNMGALDVDPTKIDHIAISHGHPDHYGGLHSALELIGRPIPVATHPDAFLPRYAIMGGDERVAPFYNATFNARQLEQAGARLTMAREAVQLAGGVVTTGEIQRQTDFEGPREPAHARAPGLYQIKDGKFALDEVWDENALVIDVRDAGLIVLTGCGHAGVINSIKAAQKLTGVDKVLAVLGGFHLGFPGTPAANVEKTSAALRSIGAEMVMPMHCTGAKAISSIARELPDSFVQYSVGTRVHFQSPP